jgi:hypothetical protein
MSGFKMKLVVEGTSGDPTWDRVAHGLFAAAQVCPGGTKKK